MKIGIFDSGIGGLPFLKICSERYPENEFYYVGDRLHFPYGEKNDLYIINRIKKVFAFFETKKVDLVLVACNTASLQLEKIKDEINHLYSFKVYSVIDLIVKNFENSSFKKGICIATNLTIENNVYANRLKKYNFCLIQKKASKLVSLIQNHHSEVEISNEIINLNLNDVDFIILGCTHFVWIKDILKKMYPAIKLFDGTENIEEIIKDVNKTDDVTKMIRIFTTKLNNDIIGSLNELKIKYNEIIEIDI